MKQVTQRIFFLVCGLLVVAVAALVWSSLGKPSPEAANPSSAKQTVAGRPARSQANADMSAPAIEKRNRIEPKEGEILIDVCPMNLDLDEEEEQILVVKHADDPEGRIHVVLADFIPDRRDWVRSWEAATMATQVKTFLVQAEDLVGDHTQSIICMGMNNENLQTASVFWRDQSSDSGGLKYRSVFELSADSIEVDKVERSEGYQLGHTNGVSWGIVAYTSDPKAANPLDQLMTRYEWNFQSMSYERYSSESIPGATIEAQKAQRILTGDAASFETYLSGMWYRDSTGPNDPDARLILFNPQSKTIVFYSQNKQEVFQWENSTPKRLGIFTTIRNQTVSSVRRFVTVELSGMDTVSIRVTQEMRMLAVVDAPWDGKYRKLDASYSANAAARPSSGTFGASKLAIAGTFDGESGDSLSFEGREYRRKFGETVESGTFALYRIDERDILELISIKKGTSTVINKKYSVTLVTKTEGSFVVSTLTLTPVRYTIKGLEPTDEESIVYSSTVQR